MKIILFSDFHGSLIAVDKAADVVIKENPDVILVAGDLAFHSIDSALSILKRLNTSRIPILYVPGNMDDSQILNFQDKVSAKCIHGKCQKISDFAFVGVGGAVQGPFMTPFECTEQEIEDALQRASKGCQDQKQVLVSHVPPKNTSLDLTRSGAHAGSNAVRNFIETAQPILAVCGHIHEARGTDRIGKTVLVNPGPAQNWFYSSIELSDTADVKLLEFV